MNPTDPIYVDFALTANLHTHLDHAVTIVCRSVSEAKDKFEKLEEPMKAISTITIKDGTARVYHEAEIVRLQPKTG